MTFADSTPDPFIENGVGVFYKVKQEAGRLVRVSGVQALDDTYLNSDCR